MTDNNTQQKYKVAVPLCHGLDRNGRRYDPESVAKAMSGAGHEAVIRDGRVMYVASVPAEQMREIMCPAVVRGGFSLGAIVRNPIKDVGDV